MRTKKHKDALCPCGADKHSAAQLKKKAYTMKPLIMDCPCGFTHRWEHGKKGDPSLEKEYYIQDWAGNDKFPDKTFASFDDAWSFLMTKFKKEEDLGEFFVMEREAQ